MPTNAKQEKDTLTVAVQKDVSPVYVPLRSKEYVEWGHSEKVEKFIKSGQFLPVWISGEAGNGKSQLVEQACAKLGRKFVRVNFTNETDENDLIGGFRLKDGDTQFQDGPVVSALREGAVLLLDEISAAGTNKVLCLQSVLEGRGVLIKSTGEWVKPAPGFQVFATCNTKGRGNDDGKYIGTNVMNGAFLDRFASMLHQPYPDEKIETNILKKYFITSVWEGQDEKNISKADVEASKVYIGKLVKWAGVVRDAASKGIDVEIISTRSLINTVRLFSVFKDEKNAETSAVKMICERYPDEIATALYDFYDKLTDDSPIIEEPEPEPEEDELEQVYPAP